MLAVFDITREVVLNWVDKDFVLAHHAQLDYMICEFYPLQRFVVVDVDLSKQVN